MVLVHAQLALYIPESDLTELYNPEGEPRSGLLYMPRAYAMPPLALYRAYKIGFGIVTHGIPLQPLFQLNPIS